MVDLLSSFDREYTGSAILVMKKIANESFLEDHVAVKVIYYNDYKNNESPI